MSDDRICKHCKWWRAEKRNYPHHGPPHYRPEKHPSCHHPAIEHDESGSDREPDEGSDGVSICDTSGYWAAIYPGENFGCVHWEAKDGGTT